MISRGLRGRNPGSHARRTPVRRRSPLLSSAQIAALVIMTGCLAGVFAIGISPSFIARTLQIRGATFTSESIVRSILGMNGSPNVFRMDTDAAARQLAHLPAVESASVQVRLPSTVIVTLVEREPKIVWAIGDIRYVVDQDGLLFGLVDSAGNPMPSSAGPLVAATEGASSSASAPRTASASVSPAPTASPSLTPEPTPTPKKSPTKAPKATPKGSGTKTSPAPSGSAPAAVSPTPTVNASLLPSLAPAPTADLAASSGPSALGLPVVYDRRASDAGLSLGGIVDSINLDAGYRLAGLTPTDIRSTAAALAVVVDDDHGFTVSSVPSGWVAEFGFYAPTVRKTTIIPEQVQGLRSTLLQYGEEHVAWVWLVADVSSNHVNTYLAR